MIVNANIAIVLGHFYPLQGQFRSSWIAPINVLSRDKRIAVISAFTEGCSTERLTALTATRSCDSGFASARVAQRYMTN
jgi:hypothetical protein